MYHIFPTICHFDDRRDDDILIEIQGKKMTRHQYSTKTIKKYISSSTGPVRGCTVAALCAYMCFALCGCSETKVPESHDISVDYEGQTGAGISAGSTYAEWITAYDGVLIQQVTDDGLVPYTPDMEAVKNAAAAAESASKTTSKAGNEGTSAEAADETAGSTPADSTDASISHDGTYMISAFYVDEVPVSVEKLMTETGLSAEELNDHLADSEYLADHTVVYRYTMFTIENDVVTDITGDYLDYNQELN